VGGTLREVTTVHRILKTIGIMFIASFPAAVTGTTWYVDVSVATSGGGSSPETAFKSIQEGINAASNGDTVIVAEGTYVENIHFKGENIVLCSPDPLDPGVVSNTVIDGNKAGSVITFVGTEDETCVLSGFTVRNGKADFGGGICGRTQDDQTRATIERNVITENSAGRGGGLYDCDGTIRNNIVTANTAEGVLLWGVLYGDGGGLYRCDGLIQNNTISGNSALGGGCPSLPCVYADGGGLTFCNGTIRDNTITGNSADRGAGLFGCDGIVEDNTISDNSARKEGGGLGYCDGTVKNNMITGNWAFDEGGGMGYCNATIQNNTITGNSTEWHGGGLSDCDGLVQNNTISGNSAVQGGGLTFCDGTIQNNTISGNSAERGGGGLYYCHGTIQSNTFSGNSTGLDGGGLSSCWGTIQNNVIARNSAGGYGGGLAGCRGPIQNNTISENSAVKGGGALHNCRGTIGNCIMWGNMAARDAELAGSATPSFSCIQDWTGGGEGNITSDPGFVDAAGGDYHLRADSPCIDAGENYCWFVWPQRDMDGNCRLAGERVDMGCYEHGATPDRDGDLLSDSAESTAGTSPDYEDSDGDGLRDGLEVLRESDPSSPTPPRTVHVPEDLPKVQVALLLSVNGEEIVVAPGRYSENLHFCGTDVILRSSDPENPDVVQSTILDGAGAGPAVSFIGSESELCVLSGFTITGGSADYGGGIDGGMWGKSTCATIENNTITGNAASSFGGGIYSCDGMIRNNTVTDNSVERYGGGLANCDGIILDNTISGNSSGGNGGGLYGCQGTIQNNTIAANTAEGTWVWRGEVRGHGGGLAHCDGTIQNNKVIGNNALNGGGLYNCDGDIRNNRITGNSASENGGGLYWCKGTILNNTIADNRADDNGGGLDYCQGSRVRNCIVWGNTAAEGDQVHDSNDPTYSCIQDWTGSGAGNIAEDPRFLDPDGPDDDPETYDDNDYRLLGDSPCIDAGQNEDWMQQAVDLDGNLRVCYGISSPTVDMGAYEYVSGEPGGGAWHVDCSVSASGDGTSWKTALATIQEGINAASNGHTIIVATGTYFENIHFAGKNIILRSTDPLDHTVLVSTIIDGGNSGSVVTFEGTEAETCVVVGFTIRNGKGVYGGGICGGTADNHTHARIENNVIISNRADYGGGVAYCDGDIRSNTISGNRATHQYGEGGALAYCDGSVQNNTISGNLSVWRGGGLSRCNGTIEDNAISGNSSSSGGALSYCKGCIQGNAISGNSAKVWGGGLHWCPGDIQNNAIVGNSAGWGGGLALCDGNIRNNTVVGNSAANSGGGLAWCDGTIWNCIIWENAAPGFPQVYDSNPITYSCIQGWAGGDEGNISLDPQFADPDGLDNNPETFKDNDYRLKRLSPCVDAGNNRGWAWNSIDLDGNPRIFYGISSVTVDIGAYEFGSWPLRIVRVLRGSDSGLQLTWNSRPGDNYSIWSCSDILRGEWREEGKMLADGQSTSWTDPDTATSQKFYRIEVK